MIDNVQIQNGLYKEKSFYGSGIPIVRIDNFYNGKLIYNNLKKLNITDEEKKRYFLKKGDILLNRVNSDEFVGKCCIFNGENSTTVYESNIMRFRVKEDKILPEYLVFYLSSVGGKEQILSKIKRAVNQVSVNQEDIKSIEIPLPKLEKQSVIIDIINKNIKTAEFLKDIRNSNKNYLKEEIDSFYSNL
ncbi:MAG: restriction endonuclease subunit S [Candidatus Omnitrophica bacterium]|nr:restriction endonuclease subunit S [Candidatus Omnitrophota bacterium]